jgi:hypothetical protein
VGKQTDQRGTKTDENWKRTAEGICMKEREQDKKIKKEGQERRGIISMGLNG